jgi:hypothetical protein
MFAPCLSSTFLPTCFGGALLATPRSCKQFPSSAKISRAHWIVKILRLIHCVMAHQGHVHYSIRL